MMKDRIYGTRMGLVVVDPQIKFTMDTPDWDTVSKNAVDGINRYASLFREFGMPVFFVRFDGPSHMDKYSEAEGWLPGIKIGDGDIIVRKKHMSCFKKTDLEEILRKHGVDSTLFVGMLTEYCVASTYFSASERGFSVYLGKGALISYNKGGNEAAETIFSMVEESTVRAFFEGKRKPVIAD